MKFNSHKAISQKHAFLSPSQYHWINYNDQKLQARWASATQAARGTALHEFAHKAIQLGIRQPRSKQTLYMYINDAIGYRMTSEQPLYYSDNCFGTPDSMGFRKNKLRIHDLKTGITKASFHQLEIYAAIFCLEYGYLPSDIDIELRIYQSNEVFVLEPENSQIFEIMDTIVVFNDKIEQLKEGDLGDY